MEQSYDNFSEKLGNTSPVYPDGQERVTRDQGQQTGKNRLIALYT